MGMTNLKDDIRDSINRNGVDAEMNSPDWLLTEYLMDCLYLFDRTARSRDIAAEIKAEKSSTK